jgi:hypothetical protein
MVPSEDNVCTEAEPGNGPCESSSSPSSSSVDGRILTTEEEGCAGNGEKVIGDLIDALDGRCDRGIRIPLAIASSLTAEISVCSRLAHAAQMRSDEATETCFDVYKSTVSVLATSQSAQTFEDDET